MYDLSPRERAMAVLLTLIPVMGVLLLQATVINWVWVLIISNPLICLLLLMIAAGIVYSYLKDSRIGYLIAAAAGVGIVVCLFIGSYESDRDIAKSVSTVTDPIPAYDERTPFVIAKNQMTSHIQSNGTIEDTAYIADKNMFAANVRSKDMFKGYTEVVWEQTNQTGQTTAKNCTFAADVPRFGGVFAHNLKRSIIYKAGPGTIIDDNDAYGYCTDDGVAMVVAPLKKMAGFPFTHEVPAGIAVLNGGTGALTVERTVPAGKYPGPTYPTSLSMQQANSTRASGGWWEYMQGNSGFEQTGDSDTVNFENSTDFNLHESGGNRDDFVTPLTLRGNSQAIYAVGRVASNQTADGQLSPYTIHRIVGKDGKPAQRQSDGAVIARIKGDYASLPGWAAGLTVYEVVPQGPQHWLATLGNSQTVQYVAKIEADSSSCLYAVDKTDKPVMCSPEGTAATDQGFTPAATPTPDQTNGSTDATSVDVSKLTDQQLADLLKKLADENQKRQAGRK